MKTANRNHLHKIKSMPCSLCGAGGPSDAHHIRDGAGMSQRNSDFLAIPLCKECHQGDNGIHGDRSLWRIYKKTEIDCLAETIKRLTCG